MFTTTSHNDNGTIRTVIRKALTCIVVGLVALSSLLYTTGTAHAEQAAIKVKQTIEVQKNGNAINKVEMKLPGVVYTNLKKQSPNTALLLRKMGLTEQAWYDLEDVKGNWEDGSSTLNIQWTTKGLGRTGKDKVWEMPIDEDLEPASTQDGVVVLTGAEQSELGLITQTTRVVLPAGSSDVKILKSPARLAFRMAVPADEGKESAAEFTLDVKPQVMSSLAKSHSNPKFSNLWIARSLFHNSGNTALKDFRVRFRVVDYTTSWSPWQTCGVVVPGQTVIDPYFPIFDLEKLARMNGSTQVMLEAQYQYKNAEGKLLEETEMKQFQMLGRNQVYFSTLKREEMVDFQDQFNLGAIILGSFVTHEDPIIQQVAGWVSGQAGGAAASLDDAEAIKFLRSQYEFLSVNKIAYQTPPGKVNEEKKMEQHVKYGRDVLRNRAGTCIDLAILYACVCDAVGLEPVLHIIPGHCFPAVRLPQSGKLVAVEATMIGRGSFEEAAKVGREELESIHSGATPAVAADINLLHKQGVHSLELPTLPVDALSQWGIKLVKAEADPKPKVEPETGKQAANDATKLVGTWVAQYESQGVKRTHALAFLADGRFGSVVTPEGGEAVKVGGTYTVKDGVLTMQYSNTVEEWILIWSGDNMVGFKSKQGGTPVMFARTK